MRILKEAIVDVETEKRLGGDLRGLLRVEWEDKFVLRGFKELHVEADRC